VNLDSLRLPGLTKIQMCTYNDYVFGLRKELMTLWQK